MRQFEGSLIVVTLTDNQGLFELDGGCRKIRFGIEVRSRGEIEKRAKTNKEVRSRSQKHSRSHGWRRRLMIDWLFVQPDGIHER